jgi:threonine/homoserine efflux transporter RhtA
MGGLAHVTAGLFAAGVGVALLSSAIPYTLEMIALRALPPAQSWPSLRPAVRRGSIRLVCLLSG